MVPLDGTLRATFMTTSLSTGGEAAADSTPTAILRKNGDAVVAATPAVVSRGDGEYHVSVLIDTAHGWSNGDFCELVASWAMSGVSKKMVIYQGYIDNFMSSLLDEADGVEDGITPRQALRAAAAGMAGLLTNIDGTVVIKGIGQGAEGTTRVTAITDGNNRSSVVLNLD